MQTQHHGNEDIKNFPTTDYSDLCASLLSLYLFPKTSTYFNYIEYLTSPRMVSTFLCLWTSNFCSEGQCASFGRFHPSLYQNQRRVFSALHYVLIFPIAYILWICVCVCVLILFVNFWSHFLAWFQEHYRCSKMYGIEQMNNTPWC